jgi:cyclase
MAKGRLWKRVLKVVGVLLLLVAGGIGFMVWKFTRTEKVAIDDRLFTILGGGGNTLVLTSDEGALVVDTKFAWPASALKKEVEAATGKPVKMVIDTHHHIDHTHGNPKFPGAEFVAHKRAREHLLADDAMFQPGGEGEKMVPTTLIEEGKQLQFGDDFVDIRYLGRGHTDGDVAVFLHRRSILHTGDLFVNGFYPIIDTKGGGSFRELGPTLGKLCDIGAAKIIPGHGPIAGPAELANTRKYVDSLWKHVLDGVRAGKSKKDILAGFDAAPYHLHDMMAGFSTLEKNVDVAFDEATAQVAAEKK